MRRNVIYSLLLFGVMPIAASLCWSVESPQVAAFELPDDVPKKPTRSIVKKSDDDPVAKAIVTGPAQSDPGDLIILDASESVATDYAWLVLPKGKTYLPVEGGRRVVFASGKEGTYTFILSVAHGGKVSVATHEVTIGKLPDPVPPGPTPPGPNPPGPTPPPGFAAECQKWLKAVSSANYTKVKAIAVADAYATVGSQGSDPARNAGWNLDTFRTKTRDLNWAALKTADEVAAWEEPFFKPLAIYQSQLFQQRGLKTTDTAKIAELWTETAEAIKAGAF